MGQYKDYRGIECFSPDNSETTLYIGTSIIAVSVSELHEKIKKHFGEDTNLDDVRIHSEHIHTRSVTYNTYDPFDYDDFIVVTKGT